MSFSDIFYYDLCSYRKNFNNSAQMYWFSYVGLKGFYEEYLHATQTPVRKLELKLCIWQCLAGIPPKTLQQIPEAIFV